MYTQMKALDETSPILGCNQTGSKKKVHDTMMKTPPHSRFREIYLPTYLPTIIWLEIRRRTYFKASSTDFQKFQIENIASQK